MTGWRLILDGKRPAAENMAMDETVMRLRPSTGLNTLRLYGWNPSAISIGYFQSLEAEVDTGECRARGVDVVRRITGGGAVYHDTVGDLTYSIVVPVDDPLVNGLDVLGSYGVLLDGLVNGLSALGMEAGFRPVNDIVVSGRKISGSAQTRRGGVILQHGTVILDVDPDLMFTLLRVPDEKVRDKMVASVKDRVTSVRHQVGHVRRDEVVAALVEGFGGSLGAELEPAGLTREEAALVPRVQRERFADPEWTGRR
ncbi:MAG: lipoate--protein ligase family protein [Thermoplasmata archaeon]|nr:lipoate--protein ligase family protein [Thermoplasmata archaeon]